MAKSYEYKTRNVYDTRKGELYSMVDESILNEMAEDGWELFEVIESASGLQRRYTQAIFRREK